MNTSWLRSCLLVAATLIVYGCASIDHSGGGQPRQECGGDCRVNVRINCQMGVACSISVPDEVHARGQNVFWEIDAGAHPSFVFDPTSGIEFKSAEGQRNFRCQVLAGGRAFKCDNARAPGRFPYGIKIVGIPRLDPWIVN